MKSNYILKALILISACLVTLIYFIYRTQNFPLGFEGLACLVSIIVLISTTIFLWKLNKKWLTDVQRKSVKLGLYFGLLWTVEISMNNILQPVLPGRDIIDNIFWAAIGLLILLTAIYYTFQTKKILAGIEAGCWSGFASGAVACITALVLIVFGEKLLLSDPVNIDEWTSVKNTVHMPNMAVYFAYETLAGAIMHLYILGILMGLILGIIGGLTGKLLLLLKTKPAME